MVRYRDAKQLSDQVRLFRRDVTENTAQTLHAIFTQLFGGDAKKAYDHVASIAERIVYDKMQFDDLTPEQKEAVFATHEAKTIKSELEKLRQEKSERENSEKSKKELDAQLGRLTSLLKTDGLDPSRKNIGRLAAIILEGRDEGLPDDEKRSLRKLREQIQIERDEILATLKADDLSDDIKETIRRESVEEVKQRSSPTAKTGAKPKPKGRSKRSYTRYATGGFADAIRSMQ
jgi:hypothetical protein